MAKREVYKVRIHYREPGYEQYEGPKKRPYNWSYSTTATSPEEAKRRAIAKFRQIQRLSSVGWGRNIVLIELQGGTHSVAS